MTSSPALSCSGLALGLAKSIRDSGELIDLDFDQLADLLLLLSDSATGDMVGALRRIARDLQSVKGAIEDALEIDPDDIRLDAKQHLEYLDKCFNSNTATIEWPDFLRLLDDIDQAIPEGELSKKWEELTRLLDQGHWVFGTEDEDDTEDVEDASVSDPPFALGDSTCWAADTCTAPLPNLTPTPEPITPYLVPAGWREQRRAFGVVFVREDGLGQVEPADIDGCSFRGYMRPNITSSFVKTKGRGATTLAAACATVDKAVLAADS